MRVLLTFASNSENTIISGDFLQYLDADGGWKCIRSKALKFGKASSLPREIENLDSFIVRNIPEPIKITSGSSRSRYYRGELIVSVKPNFQIVNRIDLEDYIRSVLPSEMPSSFPKEALKAQAVAARSYTMANLKRHEDSGADICDTDHCQAYLGSNAEKPSTDTAVSETCSQIIAYDGKTVSAQYCADCGGFLTELYHTSTHTCAPDASEDNSPAYCESAPMHRWKLELSHGEFLEALGEKRLTPVRKITVTQRDCSGRIIAFEVETDFGVISALSNTLRRTVKRLRSLLFEFSADPVTGHIILTGSGYGHGRGLCQWGARGMALPPYSKSYTDILSHYFPATQLIRLEDEPVQENPSEIRSQIRP